MSFLDARRRVRRVQNSRPMQGFGYPLYVNGQLYQEPVTISHVPTPAASGIGAMDPSFGGLGDLVSYSASKGLRGLGALFGLGDDTTVTATVPLPALPPAPTLVVMPAPAPAPAPPAPPAPAPVSNLSTVELVVGALGIASTAGLIYHGYRRNDSILWALVWGVLGGAVPIIGWPVALAQGFGDPKRMTANKRSCGCGGMKKNGLRRRTRRSRRRR
jgi:hypothetical protein